MKVEKYIDKVAISFGVFVGAIFYSMASPSLAGLWFGISLLISGVSLLLVVMDLSNEREDEE